MFRLLRTIVVLALIVLAVYCGYLWTARVELMEQFLSKRLNLTTRIETVTIGWNHLTIKGLRFENLNSTKMPYALQVDTIAIEMNPLELWKNPTYIDRIKIENPILSLELYNGVGNNNNWGHILNRFSPSKEKTFVINSLKITNLQFQIARFNGKPFSVPPIPYLEFENLGTGQSLTLSQISRILIQTILKTLTTKPSLNAILDNVPEIPQNLLKTVTSTLSLEKQSGIFQEGLKTLREKGKEATEYLHDLFSK